MKTYVLDANIISYYIADKFSVRRQLAGHVQSDTRILMAPFAYYEVKRGLLAARYTRRYRVFQGLVEQFGVGQLDNDMLDIAADLYADNRSGGQTIEDSDIFIAAFCLQNGYTLVTHNTKHFAHIPKLDIEDWAQT